MFQSKGKLGAGGFSITQMAAGVITTAALTFALLSASAAKASHVGAANPTDNAEHYGCGDICYIKYAACINGGNPPMTCAMAYSQCLNNCGSGALRVGDSTQ